LNERLDTLGKVVAQKEQERTNLVLAIAGAPSPDTIAVLTAQLDKTNDTLRELAGKQRENGAVRRDVLDILKQAERVEKYLRQRRDSIDSWTFDEKRDLLRFLGVKVTIHNTGVVCEGTGKRWDLALEIGELEEANAWCDSDCVAIALLIEPPVDRHAADCARRLQRAESQRQRGRQAALFALRTE
jgi:hypothetical protein